MGTMKILSNYGFRTPNRVFVIAEIGINHGGSVSTAKQLIDSAIRSGVDAVKFQTYLTEKRAPKNRPEIFKVLKQCELPFEAFRVLQSYATDKGVCFFSTPFDIESAEYLHSIDCDMYKIASFDVVNFPLLGKVASIGKPVIMSIGMADEEEVDAAYTVIKQHTNQIAILHCVSAYPTNEADSNLAAIYELRRRYDCVIGQSDHTAGIDVPLYAVAAGAQIIEKHYKINDQMACIDAPVSITENQMTQLVQAIRRLECILGHGRIERLPVEENTVVFRREVL